MFLKCGDTVTCDSCPVPVPRRSAVVQEVDDEVPFVTTYVSDVLRVTTVNLPKAGCAIVTFVGCVARHRFDH